ncbi:MAG: excinuclease ABC subunit A [Gammaproteobacteria bacterium TMED95]|nr:excinuclease ABC subunit A [Gammaproteobacteria bacterium]OUV22744.1 MAG: excinuclease ABC subunit A [Gammaproteobacteria bacterium TMED95]
MPTKTISIQGARTHNLQNVDLEIPRDSLTVITGLSGSGKSSLAFDTLYAEGQRRYVESLSTYARQFLAIMEKPDVDLIEGLSPAISIEQKTTSHNPRSTVGTITEIADYLRLLFARVGEPHCPDHHLPLKAQTIAQMVDQVLDMDQDRRLMLLAPVVQAKKGEHTQILKQLASQGFVRVRVDNELAALDELLPLEKTKHHTIEVVVDRFKVRPDLSIRLADSFETAIKASGGTAIIADLDGSAEDLLFSANFACPTCGYSIAALEPRLFSFNNPNGACRTCDGLGTHKIFDSTAIVRDPELSISEGAISGWDRQHVYYFQLLEQLAAHYDFSIEAPFKTLSSDHQSVILHGSGETSVPFFYADQSGQRVLREHRFEGIIPNLERRYEETSSQTVKDQLSTWLREQTCQDCGGQRLNPGALAVTIAGKNYSELSNVSIQSAFETLRNLELKPQQRQVANRIISEIEARLSFLIDVGLNYLSLSRPASTLSGGESQRIRLASQIGAGLVGVMYILDEPSIGLHQRDNQRLLGTLRRLRDIGNTVIVVEHDEEAILAADFVVDIGPGAGELGGEIIACGPISTILECPDSITGQFLTGHRKIALPSHRHPPSAAGWLELNGASGNNLKGIDLKVPLGLLTCITGVSGSGKSTLINRTLYPLAATALNGATTLVAAPHENITGLDHLDKVVDISQSPIGRTPRSNPATYTNIFTAIRDLFASTSEARSRGYKSGRFSFNVKGGRCEACQGDGLIKVEMHFLADIYVQCDECEGKRYNRETLEILYKGRNINDVLNMTVDEAALFLEAVPVIKRRLETLKEVGLGYIRLGQSATTLSGGEAQRVKLARELAKIDTGKTLYILDEPTTGLHFHDIDQLLKVIHQLRDRGNTVIVIEHNLDVVKTADWVIDLGPEGGEGGGDILCQGTPETIAMSTTSSTGQYLKTLILDQPSAPYAP